uniref:Uncharacterized protein n=1 Tax=Rhizophora mucronata TaxID=61149 RepID=A0A2P2PBR2_RHIMU
MRVTTKYLKMWITS